MVEARWNGRVIARSDDTVVVEGNRYFPLASVDAALLRPSDTTTICPWKGVAHYYHPMPTVPTIPMPSGTIPTPRRRRRISAGGWPSGKASRSADGPRHPGLSDHGEGRCRQTYATSPVPTR